MRVRLTRPLTASGGLDNEWPTDGSQSAIWSIGAVGELSNVDQPEVLYHIEHSPVASNVIAFDEPQNDCTQL